MDAIRGIWDSYKRAFSTDLLAKLTVEIGAATLAGALVIWKLVTTLPRPDRDNLILLVLFVGLFFAVVINSYGTSKVLRRLSAERQLAEAERLDLAGRLTALQNEQQELGKKLSEQQSMAEKLASELLAERPDDSLWWKDGPPVGRFWERFMSDFVPTPDAQHCHYIARTNVDVDGKLIDRRPATYLLLVEEDVRIDEFRAFMIPPLDAGHGAKGKPLEERGGRFHPEFDQNWDQYLRKLAKKFKDRHPPVDAKRILFFDKTLLQFLIGNAAWIAQKVMKQEETRPVIPLMTSMLQYAHNIVNLHELMTTYQTVIDCRYRDKNKVKTSDYCDFGYYLIDGIRVVYTPIYEKGFQKRILEERMFIGRSRRHNERIDEYLKSFKHMWESGEDDIDEQNNVESHEGLPLKGYESYSTLSLRYFDWTYYQALKDIFNRFPELDLRPSSSES